MGVGPAVGSSARAPSRSTKCLPPWKEEQTTAPRETRVAPTLAIFGVGVGVGVGVGEGLGLEVGLGVRG